VTNVARGSIVVKALCYKPGSIPGEVNFYIFLILQTALGPKVYSASNRNEYQKVKLGGCLGLTTLPPSVSRLSRQCGILNISQPSRPQRPVTGIALLQFVLIAQIHFEFMYLHTKNL
jgi:hypothetical protein